MKIHEFYEFYESVSDSLEYNELEARELESVSRIFASNSFKFIQKFQKLQLWISAVSIRATSAPSERAFSLADNLISKKVVELLVEMYDTYCSCAVGDS